MRGGRFLFVCLLQAFLITGAYAQFVINELLFNPPGADLGAEAIELRGPANARFTNETYLVFVEGDQGGIPGSIQNVFELSDAVIGGNGFLILLQKDAAYPTPSAATRLQNTGRDDGWGDGSGSTIEHRGELDQLDLENGSFSCFLVESSVEPDPGDTIDADTNGVPDGAFTTWVILDSVGMLDDGGAGDVSYAAITFRRGPQAMASGTVVDIAFRPSYLARQGNSSGSAAGDWLAGDSLTGVYPNWILGSGSNSEPASFAGRSLNHWGAPNFGAPEIPGVILEQVMTGLPEGNQTILGVRLNTDPITPLLLRMESDADTRISIDGTNYFTVLSLNLSDTNTVTVHVQSIADKDVETSPHFSEIEWRVQVPSLPDYPSTTYLPDISIAILDDDALLLNEVNVNPPGTDGPNEYIEISGVPGARLDGVYLLGVEGDDNDDPGVLDVLLDLTGQMIGTNGFLLILAPDHPYAIPPETGVFMDPRFSASGGLLPNGSLSFLLVTSADPPDLGDDLDRGDNGILEGLAADTQVLDSLGWTDGDTDDLVFSSTVLDLPAATPDAAMRIGSNIWFRGSLGSASGDPLAFGVESDGLYHLGTRLSPGAENILGPSITVIDPISGVIGDPTNPAALFHIRDAARASGSIQLTAFTSNPAVIPAANIQVLPITNSLHEVQLDPVGAGYASVTVRVSDAQAFIDIPFEYAASDPGRTNSIWLTGVSDASAAWAINEDLMLVGDDEGQEIRLYPRDRSGAAIRSYDLNPFLALTDFEDGVPREVDIEGVTRNGNFLYWLGSHSHAEIGELRTNRWRVISTELSGQGTNSVLDYRGHYEHLRTDLISWDQSNGHGLGLDFLGFAESARAGVLPKSSDGSGFNFEAFTMAPDGTNTAYICFRAPLVPATNRAYACIVPVRNIHALAGGNGAPGSAQFDPPILLDLACRGLRSIHGDTNGYLMVAGEVDNRLSADAFRFFTWTGRRTDAPIPRAGDFTQLNPEGIVALPPPPWTASSQVQLVSDNGRAVYYEDGIIAKLLPEPAFKKFRVDTIALGEVVVPAARIRDFEIQGDGARLTWCAPAGHVYQVQTSTDLLQMIWTNLSGPIILSHPIFRYEWQPDRAPLRSLRVLDLGSAGP